MDIDADAEEASRRVQVRFVTKLKPPYKAPPTSIAIPTNLTRFGLSALVNNLLKAGNYDWKTEAFDFLIDGELVRMSLEEFLLAKGISAEKILEIEYIKAVAPRKEEEPSLHDDWVSAVDGSNPRFILTGCYDGLGRIWKAAGLCTHLLEGHTGAITSVCILNPQVLETDGQQVVATASKDTTLKLFKVNTAESLGQPMKIQAFKSLRGHNASVQCIAAAPSGDKICSGSWDNRINLWRANDSNSGDDSVSVKKRKTETEDEEPKSEGEAISTLVGHTQCVSSVVWPEHETLYSASWDHSIRRWDVETGKDSMNMDRNELQAADITLTCVLSDRKQDVWLPSATDLHLGDVSKYPYCGKVFNCLDVGGESFSLIAAGGSDPILRIWDPRKPGNLAPTFQFSSHTSWISGCKWHDKSWYHLVSASYDGKVMLWDLRTAWPLAIIDSHVDKVLCTNWWKNDCIISGGADSKLCISSEISVM